MKTRYYFLPVLLALLTMTACTHKTVVVKEKNVPPGQIKKVTGSKSAKPYAPGQQKKL